MGNRDRDRSARRRLEGGRRDPRVQFGGFTWRLKRELERREGSEGRVWIPPADFLNLLALIVVVVGAFLWPILDLPCGVEVARNAFGLGLILLVGYPFALAGHYGLLRPRGRPIDGWEQHWLTPAEWTAIVIVLVAAAAYLVAIVVSAD